MTEKETKRTGRPLNQPEPGRRVSLGLKVTAEMKRRIDDAARRNGRTQSQEAEARLEQAFMMESFYLVMCMAIYGALHANKSETDEDHT